MNSREGPLSGGTRARLPIALAGAAVFAASTITTGSTSASPLFELTGGVAGDGGLTARASGASAASTYFNPAFLPDAESGLTLGTFFLRDQISVSLDGRPSTSVDVPQGLENAEHADGSRFDSYPLPTTWLNNGRAGGGTDPALPARPRQGQGSGKHTRGYQAIGLVTKFFKDRLAIGLYAMVPYSSFTGAAAFYSDEREQYFTNSLHPELYADRLTATSLAFGSGFKINDQISVGMSFTLSLRTTAYTPTYVVDAGRFKDIMIDSKVDVNASVSPHFGVVYKPLERLRLTGTVHTPQKFEVKTDFTFLLANGIEQAAGVNFTHAYVPWQFALGSAYDILKSSNFSLTAVAVAKYVRWSDYVDRHSDRPIAAYGWFDTLSPAGGVRLKAGATSGFLDVEFQPSPVPLQTGRSNYVDNDRIGTSLGVDQAVTLWGTVIHLGAQMQLHYLPKRITRKISTPTSPDGINRTPALVTDEVPDDATANGAPMPGRNGLQTNNPGWPGWSSQGIIFGGGLYIAVKS